MIKKNILFVDDNQNIINGIKRALRRERNNWVLFFACSAEDALELMAYTPIDLIVTDMMMPNMPGDQLLMQVAEQYPATIRFILSGYANETVLKKAMKVAHQYLSKPCDITLLKETIFQVFKIQSCINNPHIIDSIGDISQLPSLPTIYQQLKLEVAKDNSTSDSIAKIFSHDIAFSAKLLQIVNSPYFGLKQKISNLSQAVNLIGVQQLTDLVLSTFIKESFLTNNLKHTYILECISANSIRVAVLAKKISLAEGQGEDRPDQAFLGALLHNMGLLIFMSKLPDKFNTLLEELKQTDTSIIKLEKQIFGFTRAEVAAYILGLWRIPPRVIESILLQFNPNETEYDGINALTAVHVATALLKPPGIQESTRLFECNLDITYLERIGKLEQIAHWQELAQTITQK